MHTNNDNRRTEGPSRRQPPRQLNFCSIPQADGHPDDVDVLPAPEVPGGDHRLHPAPDAVSGRFGQEQARPPLRVLLIIINMISIPKFMRKYIIIILNDINNKMLK